MLEHIQVSRIVLMDDVRFLRQIKTLELVRILLTQIWALCFRSLVLLLRLLEHGLLHGALRLRHVLSARLVVVLLVVHLLLMILKFVQI